MISSMKASKEQVFRDDNVVLAAAVIKAILQDWYLKRWKYRSRKVSVDRYADFVIHVAESILADQIM